MEEETEICRVCRSEGTADQPLFHPCKCAGSIRYIHQDCLIEWLSHSKKKYCELCEHPFQFTPVYRQDMPDVLPTKLVFQQFQKRVAFLLMTVSRAVLVSCIWLIILPYFTVWIWRLYFHLGNHVSKRLVKLQEMRHQLSTTDRGHISIGSILFNITMANTTTSSDSWIQDYTSKFTLQSFLADCFEGQIITCIVVIIFVAVFLLREWIVQNIPAPVVEEEEPEELIRPPLIRNANTFFDIHWEDQEDAPPSPVAQDFPDLDDYYKPRAQSMPPTSSSSSVPELQHTRSSSMEPFIDTSPMPEFRRGHPPNAPRLRHAEALLIRPPIIEEEEEEELIVVQQPNPPVQPIGAPADDEEEEEEENIEEFEGVLEAIGMNGSLWSLLQNSALMGLLIALSLGAAVWMPYLIGMLFIMTETLDIIRIPLKLTRYMTDPVIDFLFMLCGDYIWPAIRQTYHTSIEPTFLFNKIALVFKYMNGYGLLLANSSHTVTSNETTLVDYGIQYMTKLLNETEPLLEQAFVRYQALATGQTAVDRFACVAVGYLIVILVSFWYLGRPQQNNLTTAAAFGRTAQEAIRHQGIIFKVGMFIAVELILFPIVCGLLLDASTLPLFKQASFPSRFDWLRLHPVPFVFLHWFLGTGFMFLFAVLVTICRDVVRPGVMWFIRDPNDPQFHPIREIVERPVFFQFKKIGASALIYMTVILVGVGGVVHCIDNFLQVLPLRWSLSDYADTSHPLSVVPIDLIVIQVGIPAIVKYFQPKQTIKRLFVFWTTFVCKQLRLTSFIFGGRRAEEEGSLVYHTWWAWLTRAKPAYYPAAESHDDVTDTNVSYVWEGQLLRVPRHDSVQIVDRRRMLVPIDNVMFEPIDETERRLGHPAASAPGGEEVNTVIVYSPPHFKHRLVLFVGFMWLSSSIAFCAMTVLPVILGRFLFEAGLHVENEVHDIYSFVFGGAVLLLSGAFLVQFCKSVIEVWSQASWADTMSSLATQVSQWSSWAMHWTWFIVSFGGVLPIVFGTLIELYFVLPLKHLGQESPSVEVMPMWSHGFACMVILHGAVQISPDSSGRDLINSVFRRGIGNMDIKKSFTKILGPVILASCFAIGLPYGIAYINMQIVARTDPELRVRLVQIAYPTTMIGMFAYLLGKVGSRISTRLTETIREDNYLVGRTLHNLEH